MGSSPSPSIISSVAGLLPSHGRQPTEDAHGRMPAYRRPPRAPGLHHLGRARARGCRHSERARGRRCWTGRLDLAADRLASRAPSYVGAAPFFFLPRLRSSLAVRRRGRKSRRHGWKKLALPRRCDQRYLRVQRPRRCERAPRRCSPAARAHLTTASLLLACASSLA
jgi:hypothetical protein